MELYKEQIFQIFKQNYPSHKIVDSPFGPCIKIPARDAFIFSSVTGAGYLNNSVLPFSPKGLLKLFFNAFNYNIVTGIFDHTTIKYSPYLLSLAHPYLNDTDYKYIIPVEFKSDSELQKLLRRYIALVDNPTDYLILRIETSKCGNGLEGFMEYLACTFFSCKGYICENQIPLAHAIGSPDFGGYVLDDLYEHLNSESLLPRGFNIIELALLRIFPNQSRFNPVDTTHDFIVGEAKTSTPIMSNQLNKYLATSVFDEGFEIHPAKQIPGKNYHGLLTLNANYELIYTPPQVCHSFVTGPYSKAAYHAWLTNYMKYYLVSNLDNDEFLLWYTTVNHKALGSQDDLIAFVNSLNFQDIFKQLKINFKF